MNIRSIVFALTVIIVFSIVGCRDVFTGKREARGVWFARFEYANTDPEKSKARITDVLEKARAAKMNMIFFQVRGNGDAYYKSHFEPWAESLSGTLGKDPGWDPLAYAVGEAHRLGLELHAWINTFPIWRGKNPPVETTPRSPYLEHPEWLVCDSEGKPMKLGTHYVNISPGVPAARQHVIKVALDIVSNYDVDGIHFDYIRYPEDSPKLGYSHDSISVTRFRSDEGNPDKLDWDNWQRSQLNEFVFGAYNAVVEKKPWVKVSAAVIGKYSGSGWTAYSSVYQDARRWMELGKMDFIVPMTYWERDHKTHPFGPLIAEWNDRVAYDRQVFSGLYVTLKEKFGWSEIAAEIEETRNKGLPGMVFFASRSLEQSWQTLGIDEFPYWANVPRTPWKDSLPPQPPIIALPVPVAGGVKLSWKTTSEADSALYCNVYRSSSPNIDISDVKNLTVVSPRGSTEFVDSSAPEKETWYYGVTGFDHAGNESALSNIVSSKSSATAARITQ